MDGISESNTTGPHLTFEAPYQRHNNNIARRILNNRKTKTKMEEYEMESRKCFASPYYFVCKHHAHMQEHMAAFGFSSSYCLPLFSKDGAFTNGIY